MVAEPIKVFFDQNCMNARGTDPTLAALERKREEGWFQQIANPRNLIELEDKPANPRYAALARKRLEALPMAKEGFRIGVSRLDEGVLLDHATDARTLFQVIFPKEDIDKLERQNSLHDVMHIANAEDNAGDIFITNENAIVDARERLGLRIRIMRPSELLALLENAEASGEGEPNG